MYHCTLMLAVLMDSALNALRHRLGEAGGSAQGCPACPGLGQGGVCEGQSHVWAMAHEFFWHMYCRAPSQPACFFTLLEGRRTGASGWMRRRASHCFRAFQRLSGQGNHQGAW